MVDIQIPNHIELSIKRYASAHHLTERDAVVQLLEVGLEQTEDNPALQGLGLFASDEDRLAMDQAVALAYEERSLPSTRKAVP